MNSLYIFNLFYYRLKDTERDLLQILDQPDCYCTVLYNDETHTFEQVFNDIQYNINNDVYIKMSRWQVGLFVPVYILNGK